MLYDVKKQMEPKAAPSDGYRGLLLLLLLLPAALQAQDFTEVPEETQQHLVASSLQVPLSFEANIGQANDRVEFLSRGSGYTLFLTPEEAVLSLRRPDSTATDVVHLQLLGANPNPEVAGLDAQPGFSNYFVGNNPAKWRTGVPHYGKVRYRSVYPGIDLIYYGTDQRRLEYDFAVSPGADPSLIRLSFSGADSLRLDDQGNLVLHTPGGEVVLKAPVAYQEIGGMRRAVESGFTSPPGPLSVPERGMRFALGPYDPSHPLIIDPVLSYSTYLGGSGVDTGVGIAVDGSGNVYVTGLTTSTNFPTQGSFQASNAGAYDIFVTKLNASGSALTYSTYLGGSGEDRDYDIAVDGSGNAYVTGWTESTNFPTASPYQASHAGGARDAFVAKLNASGSALTYSTYLGGSGSDEGGTSIAVDGSGNAYFTGYTNSTNFPTASAYQASYGGGAYDAFVVKLNASGSALTYSTYLGGSGFDQGNQIAVDGSGAAYLSGQTGSTNFPTASAYQASNAGGTYDVFVTKFNASGSALTYSTYLGGSGDDASRVIAVDGSSNAYFTGYTTSTNFPTANPIQTSNGGGAYDAFVTKLNAAGSALTYSTYLGGSGDDQGTGIAVDASGNVYVTGLTASTNFPTASPYQASNGGGTYDAFVTKLNIAGSALAYSTYLGGSGSDQGNQIAVDGSGNAYVMGATASTNFPTASAYQGAFGGGTNDAFITKFHEDFNEVGASAGVDDAGNGTGVAWGDYDNDGDLDLYLANSGTNRLYRNNNNGTFTEVGASAGVDDAGNGRGAAWGDYDNDGDLDLYLANLGSANRLYRNNGNGTFTEIGASAGVNDAGDGVGVAWGDFDNDGDLDLYLANTNNQTNRLYRNNNNGTFAEVGASAGVNDAGSGTSAAWGDYDNDGDLDLYLANNGSANRLYRNNNNGTFAEVGASAGVNDAGFGTSATWGDYDNDGDLDLYLANDGSANRLYRNEGNGAFAEVGAAAGVNDSGAGYGVSWGDFDNDGDLDLYLANSGGQADKLYRNNNNGTFTEVGASAGVNDAGNGEGVAWGDYDNDGDLDLYLANYGQANRLFKNNGNTNKWLIVKLVGTVSNKDGIGAKVRATTGATTQRRDVDGGSGRDSQPSLPLEFGFGSTNTVDQLIVTWPSGNTNTLTNVSTNQTITVTELATPTLSSPADAATAQPLSLTLSWNAVSGATSYQLQVSTVSNFASTIFDNATLTGTSQAISSLSYNTTYYWRVRANNSNSTSAYSTTRSFTTNTAPVATAQTATGNEDADLAITLSGTDADGQTLSAIISTLPANGSLYQTADGTTRGTQVSSVPTTVTDASKRVIYVPPANGNGAGHGNFGFKVNDGLADSPEATVTVNVTAINDAPTLSAIADPTAILENAGVQTVTLSGIGTGVANESQVLTVSASSSNTALIPHPGVSYTSPNATGSLSYTPVAKASGNATITVTVTDDGGTANGGVNTVSQSFLVRVHSVNSVADFTLSYSSPVRAGDGIDLAMTFLNPFGRSLPYTGKVRLLLNDGRILGAGEQQVANAQSATFPLQTQVFRTADGSTSAIPFRLEVEGVGHKEGSFQVRSRLSIPSLSLPVVEVRRGGGWVVFEQVSFAGGRTERLRLRNPNRLSLRGLADLSYRRHDQPALLGQWEARLEPGAVQEFDLSLPLYLDIPGGAGPLRLLREGTEGPPLTLADGEPVRYADAPSEVREASFTPVQITPVLLGNEAQPQYGVFLSFGLQFQGEEAPRTSYAYTPSQANGYRFAHSLEVGVEEPGVLEVVQDGRQTGLVNRVKVVARTAAFAQVQLRLGPLSFVYPLEVAAPAQALLAQITRFEVYQPRPGNLLTGVWTPGDRAVPRARVRAVVEATDLSPLGGITAVGVEVEGQVMAVQEVKGHPEAVRVPLEVPLDLPQRAGGEVALAPFALNTLGQRSPSEPQRHGRSFTFAPETERLQYRPHGAGDRVFGFEGARPGSQYVAIGVRVSQGQVVSTSTARVQVVSPDGRVMDPQGYWVNYPTRVRLVHGDEGGVLLIPQSAWDPQVLARWIRLQTRTSAGVGLGAVGVYVSPRGGVQVDYLFPYVEEGSAAAKPVALRAEDLEELRATLIQMADQLPSAAEVLEAWQRGELGQPREILPERTALLPNFPNPFNPRTQILFELAEEGWVQLGIYNLLGQPVRTLVDEYRPAGAYRVEWDGRDEAGQPVGSGVYLYRLQTEESQETEKMLLLR